MAQVLVLSAPEDSARAEALVKSLERAGVKAARAGAAQAAAGDPSCLIVCHSANSQSLLRSSEALLKRLEVRGRAVHVRLDKVAPADPDSVDLSHWLGGQRNPALAIVRDKVQSILRTKPNRRLAWLTGPRTMAALAYLGLGGALLQLAEPWWRGWVRHEVWTPAERRYPLFESGPPRPTRTEADLAAGRFARAQAQRLCAQLAVGGEFRLVSVATAESRRECSNHAQEWRCTWQGTARCGVKIREVR